MVKGQYKDLISKILEFSLILVALTIPLHNNVNSWAIVFFCIVGGATFVSNRFQFKSPALVIAGFVFILWYALSYFWDTSGGFTIKNLEGYVGFIFIPFAFWMIPALSAKTIWRTCMAFTVCVTVLSFICLFLSYNQYRETGDTRVFYYHYLSGNVQLNAIFLSSYCVAGICWLLYFRFIRNEVSSVPGKILTIIWCVYLFGFVFLLSSKLVIFLMMAFLAFLLIYIGIKKRALVISIILLGIMVIAAVIAINKFYYLRWRLAVTELTEYRGEMDDQNGFAARLLMWRSATELVKERPVVGYGIRGAHEALLKKYQEKKFALGVEHRYHAHNQYLQTALIGGLVGLGFFLSFLVIACARAARSRSVLLTLILVHFMCLSIVESTLEMQQEIVFFIFFLSMFYFHLAPRMHKKEKMLAGN